MVENDLLLACVVHVVHDHVHVALELVQLPAFHQEFTLKEAKKTCLVHNTLPDAWPSFFELNSFQSKDCTIFMSLDAIDVTLTTA